MINFLVRSFIKDYENIKDEKVRARYGFLSSSVGIICNIILFGVKYLMGIISGSIAIISDAFNNLSDAGNCVMTLFAYKLAGKPADKDHPFGHGRIEYIASLIVSAVILFVGVDLFKTSIDKVINPEEVQFSTVVLVSLIVSILIKFWMAHFNNVLGKKINSSVMLATAKDSLSDCIATAASVVAIISSLFTTLPVDGVMGIVVSAFILKAGYEIIKDTVDLLIGKPADKETVDAIKEIIFSSESILGIHDMIIHSYGPGVTFGSLHVEVSSSEDILKIHDIIDNLEQKVYESLKIILTIHMDPIEIENEYVNMCKERTKRVIEAMNEEIEFHDFRVVKGKTHTNLIFDIVVPFSCKLNNSELVSEINKRLNENSDENYHAVITIDREYVQSKC